uniref:Uncharacterized protein n=1 Tax=Nelumbo nucifera TaxID=4432 RepID=A0A822ZR24_NELNU|nr:TPA_asm: hypothetical protein HUJ06_017274 [Nelumbo nucifera]
MLTENSESFLPHPTLPPSLHHSPHPNQDKMVPKNPPSSLYLSPSPFNMAVGFIFGFLRSAPLII